MRFKLLASSHDSAGHGAAVKTYVKGDVVESEHDLCALFKNKFEKLPDLPKAVKAAKVMEKVEDEEVEEEVVQNEEVTADFKDATALDVKVFHLPDGTFQITDASSTDKALNEDEIKTIKGVKNFLKAMKSQASQE